MKCVTRDQPHAANGFLADEFAAERREASPLGAQRKAGDDGDVVPRHQVLGERGGVRCEASGSGE